MRAGAVQADCRVSSRRYTIEQVWKTCVLVCGFATLLVACSRAQRAPALPPGHHVVGRTAAVVGALDALATLTGTPAARVAASLRVQIADCDVFIAQATRAEALIDTVQCVEALEAPAWLARVRGDAALGFAFEHAPGRHISGHLAVAETGALEITATMDPAQAPGLAALLVPGDEPAGPPALDARDAVAHARVRPASGLDLAALVSQDSQADQMFRLRSELFVGTLLDGTWEAAIYLPPEDRVTPPMVLALDHSIRAGAQVAMEKFVAELEATWPIHHSDREIAGYPGACFHDLKLLPDLVPCYVVSERSIVVGWDPLSIELAIGRTGGNDQEERASDLAVEGGLVVHLDRLPEADRRVRGQLGGVASSPGIAELWDALHLEGSGRGGRIAMRLSLERSGAGP
ncbi:MAG: hypothetical protein GY944_12795 [bacterium]|nr:hypothetical protein [bacterium]